MRFGGDSAGGAYGGFTSSSVDLASPGAIGGTTPAAGTFTQVTATTNGVNGGFIALISGQNPLGFTRNSTTGGMNFHDGSQATPADGTAEALLSGGLFKLESGNGFGWAVSAVTQNADTAMWRAAPNSILYNGTTTAATTTSRTEINKQVTGIADNTATPVLTVTIPNGAHSASMRVVLKGAAGGGGAVGADESTRSIEYRVDVTRTAGANAVATLSAPGMNPAAATVAGGNGITVTGTIGAISGAVGATNTFPINVTIARAAGTATNHICFPYAELLNDNASGVTIA